MKKSFISMFTILIALCTTLTYAISAEYTKFSKDFVKNFKDCDLYEETINSEFQGKNFTTNRKILGWRNGFCRYQETVSSPSEEYKLNCSFNAIQTEELYDSMKTRKKDLQTYELETFVPQTDNKTGQIKYASAGTTSIKGNQAYISWAKYENNPYFCVPTKVSK